MKQTIKNIIKYLVVFAIIGTVVYFGIKLIFPEPNPLQAYNNNIELAEIETFDKVNDNVHQLVTLAEPNLADPTFNLENYKKLLFSKATLTSLSIVNENIIDDLVFAKNTQVYNSNVKSTTKLLGEIKETYSKVDTYLTNNLIPYLEQNNASVSSLNLYINAMIPFYNELCGEYQSYTSANIQIVNQLNTTVRNNAWSQTILNIVDKWTAGLITKLNNTQTNFTAQLNNANNCLVFVLSNVNEVTNVSYYSNYQTLNSQITEINAVNIVEIVNVVSTENESTYIDGITDEALKIKTTNVLTFLKGEI